MLDKQPLQSTKPNGLERGGLAGRPFAMSCFNIQAKLDGLDIQASHRAWKNRRLKKPMNISHIKKRRVVKKRLYRTRDRDRMPSSGEQIVRPYPDESPQSQRGAGWACLAAS
jgi:hypothetical protein